MQLKQKFEQEQQDRKLRSDEAIHNADRISRDEDNNLDRASREKISANSLEAQREAQKQAERHFQITDKRQRQQFAETQGRLQDASDTRMANDAMKGAPTNTQLQQADRLEKVLQEGRVPKGWGRALTSAMSVTPDKAGAAMVAAINSQLSGKEQQEAADVMGLLYGEAWRDGGKNLTATELIGKLREHGMGPGQGDDAFRQGLKNLTSGVRSAAKRAYAGRSQGTQAKLRERGITPADYGEPDPNDAANWEPQ